jgi:hypothetical protein
LADESKLCSKKDFMIEKSKQLLKKLGGEVRNPPQEERK